ncbi:hypothetical protein [Acidicapsa ligni]|uniref:hypothetical protein n=1 Tax=Acidicapsa ligni TaxID=542300 RepID=UPI0021E0423A|nr:hypothetical protein [Acidicapsa ligni]
MNAEADLSQANEASGPGLPPPLSYTDCWALTQRIVASEHFSKSERLPKFLSYICDRELHGLSHEITEQQIGVRVFNRPADYNPGDDNIVRNYAGQLRKRLDLYFEREGMEEKIRIRIPRGAYVPVFERQESSPLAVDSQLAPPLDNATQEELSHNEPLGESVVKDGVSAATHPSHPRQWKMFLLGVLACASVLSAFKWLPGIFHSSVQVKQTAPRSIWSEIFVKDRDTFIVPADSGLGILQNLSEQQASLSDYVSGKYLSEVNIRNVDLPNVEDLRTQRYTSIVDLNIIARLARLPEAVPDRTVIRFARDLRMEDLRDGNAILLGAIHTDPWVDMLQKQLNFQFVCESHVNHCSVVNVHPESGEKTVFENDSQQRSHQTYGVVALIPNLNRTGRILLIEGLNMAATQAAADALLDEATMRPIIQQATRKNGTVSPFELLIETTSVDAAPLPPRIIASRFDH